MKKTSSFNARNGVKKQQESKSSSTTRGSSKVSGFGTSSAAFNRRSPVVTDQTIATNSVIQAATDPKIKELVMKQQQIFERESMDKRTPRNNSRDSRADGISSHFHTVDHSSSATSHQSFQQQQQFWKAALDIGDSGPSESSVDSPEKSYGNKFLASSPDTHQQQLHHYMQQQCAATPGSAVETVVHDIPVVSSHNDDDGAGSEVTADAGYMMMHKQNPAVPPDSLMGVSPSAAAAAGTSPSLRSHLHMYMDMNASLLHDHHTLTAPATKVPHASPLNHGIAAGVPPPPPLSLPQASAEATVPGAGGSLLLDPKELNDEALQAAYFRFLVEMETRGLQSMTLNAGPVATAAPIVGQSSSSSCMSGAQVPVVENDSRVSSPLAHAERISTHSSGSKPAPSTAHSTHLNPNTNPVDIRKNVYRSKSGGSEAAFFPNGGIFPAPASSAPPTGRKTPNSPLMGRYMHSAALGDAAHEELNWAPEGEDAELRKAFGQYRHPGSPSYPAYSPFHHLTQPYPGSHHASGQGHHPAGGHHAGTTPTSVAVGSANWNGANTVPHATAVPSGAAHANHAITSRSVSRCSGVIPASDDLPPGMRSNCLSTLPPTYSQYMYTSGAQTSGGAGAVGAQASGAGQGAAADLKTPKFVRKFQGMGAGLLGLTTQRYAHKEASEREEEVEVAKKSRSGSGGGSAQTGKATALHTSNSNHAPSTRSSHHGRDSAASLQSKASDFDHSIDAVKIAGGFDQLLLPAKLLSKRNSSLIPDEHSAFDDCSVGSMSLNSARSGGKKTPKTR